MRRNGNNQQPRDAANFTTPELELTGPTFFGMTGRTSGNEVLQETAPLVVGEHFSEQVAESRHADGTATARCCYLPSLTAAIVHS